MSPVTLDAFLELASLVAKLLENHKPADVKDHLEKLLVDGVKPISQTDTDLLVTEVIAETLP